MPLSPAARSNQPFREECHRVVSTFFRPGAKKELPINEEIRDLVLNALENNTHPDVVNIVVCSITTIG